MNDMSESKRKRFIAELLADGKRAQEELHKQRKAKAALDKFSGKEGQSGFGRRLTDVQKAANPYAERRALEKLAGQIDAVKRKKFNIKGTKVAAFLWLPQFHMCFRGGAHIYPVFMRLIASLLVYASLLPTNHPALKYGDPSVPKTSFGKMMGDVWFRLRTNRSANWYQYSLFSVVVAMVVTLVATLGTFFSRIFLGVGQVAQAQLYFTHPADPYGAGAGITDVTQATNNITGAAGLFDSRVENNGISTHYGLMVLDKILRQAASDTPNGGAMQNALGDLMVVYTSGVTIVASVILLWIITSVVIDTAKSGTLGGGRHNMVWGPIRILFAAALLMPIGGSGFTAGQYGVMKLAEWGSNFGTRAWSTYVASVVSDQSLLVPFDPQNAQTLAAAISKVMVCQVAYNTYLSQAQGWPPAADQIIERKQNTSLFAKEAQNHYTNNTGSNICGTIKYSTDDFSDDMDRILAAAGGVAPINTPMTGSTPATQADFNPTISQFRVAARQFRNAMRGAMEASMTDTVGGGLASGGATIEFAREFACRFVSHKFSDGGSGTSPVASTPHCDGTNTAATPNYPTFDNQRLMIQQMQTDLTNQYNGPGKTALTNYITGPMITAMQLRGWAGMGMWFQQIAGFSALIADAKEPTVTVEPGSVWGGASGTSFSWLRCLGSKIIGRSCRVAGIEEKTVETLDAFDKWWDNSTQPGDPGVPNNTAVSQNADINTGSAGNAKSILSALKNASFGDNGFMTVVARFFVPQSTNVFLFRAVDVAATGTYPLAQLADTGHSVLGFGALVWGGVSLIQAVSTIEAFGFSLGIGVAASALLNFFATIGTMMIMAGLMISFYLPVLPCIRVAFAVLTWMLAVFEAVVMVPIAALAHLVSTGDGLTGGQQQIRLTWLMWLSVLMRPVLTVMGFVGGMLIYNTFAVYFHTTFSQGASGVLAQQNYFIALFAKAAYSVIYLGTLYTAANTSFKLMEIFPENMMRWMGASPDRSFRQEDTSSEAMMLHAAHVAQDLDGAVRGQMQLKINKNDAEDAKRVANIRRDESQLSDKERDQARRDKASTLRNMSASDKTKYDSMSGPDKDKFLADKFVQQQNAKFVRLPWEQGLGGNRWYK